MNSLTPHYEPIARSFARYPVPLQRAAAAQRRAFHDHIREVAKVQCALLPAPVAIAEPVVQETVVIPPKKPESPEFLAAQAILRAIVGVQAIDIQRMVAAYYKTTVGEMLSPKRFVEIVWPRQVAMYLVRYSTRHKSLPEIGRVFGGRDHTTSLSAVRKVTARIASCPKFAAEIIQFRIEIGALWAQIGASEA